MTPIEVFPRVFVGLPSSPVPKQVRCVVYAAAEVEPNKLAAPFVLRCPLVDEDPAPRGTRQLIGLAMLKLRQRFDGKQSLLFVCGPGLNRSTLLAGVMVRQGTGFGAEGVLRDFKRKLGPAAMTNTAFLEIIRRPLVRSLA